MAEAVGYDSAGKFSSAFRERYLLPSGTERHRNRNITGSGING